MFLDIFLGILGFGIVFGILGVILSIFNKSNDDIHP
jgi:hypothetical protein